MNLKIIRKIASLENSDDLHLSRILFLLYSSSKRKKRSIAGITKLAKLDFLLRYPNCLERALQYLSNNTDIADIKEFERTTIESRMIRFRYGPWDDRYRRWIGLLVSKELAHTYVQGRTVHIEITQSGEKLCQELSKITDFEIFNIRSGLIVKAVGNYSATKIMNFIYEVFPELSDMKWGKEISL